MENKEIKKIGKDILKHIKDEIVKRSDIRKFIKENTVDYERDQKAEGVNTNTEWDRGYNQCLESLGEEFLE